MCFWLILFSVQFKMFFYAEKLVYKKNTRYCTQKGSTLCTKTLCLNAEKVQFVRRKACLCTQDRRFSHLEKLVLRRRKAHLCTQKSSSLHAEKFDFFCIQSSIFAQKARFLHEKLVFAEKARFFLK